MDEISVGMQIFYAILNNAPGIILTILGGWLLKDWVNDKRKTQEAESTVAHLQLEQRLLDAIGNLEKVVQKLNLKLDFNDKATEEVKKRVDKVEKKLDDHIEKGGH